MKRAGKTIECFNDIRKYLFEHKVPALTFIRDGKTEILYTQMYIDEKDKEIERLNNIIKNLDKMFEYYFIGNKKYDENTVNTIYIKYIKLKELKESDNNENKIFS